MDFQKKMVKSEIIKLRVSIEEKRQFQKFFESHNVSISDGVRQLIMAAIKEDEEKS